MATLGTHGFTIAIEGIDNVGKTTLVRSLSEFLIGEGVAVHVEPEFGDQEFGRYIQSLVYENWKWVPPLAQPYVIAADRAHRYKDALSLTQNGNTVIFDRHLLSSVVYQGVALQRKNEVMWRELNALYGDCFIQPDLTIVLDASVNTAVSRGGDDVQTKAFLAEARKRFLAEIDGQRIQKVDAELSPTEVHEAALGLMERTPASRICLKEHREKAKVLSGHKA